LGFLKIKYTYIWLISLVIISVFVFKLIYRSGVILLFLLLYIILFVSGFVITSQLFDFLIMFLVLFCFKKSKLNYYNNKQEFLISVLHYSILFLFLISVHQIYNFLPLFKFFYQSNIYIKSINNYIYNNLNVFHLKTSLIVVSNDIITGIYNTGIFEKKLYYSNTLTFFELYTYNNQTLIQLYGGLLFILIFILLFTLFKVCKQSYKNINL